MSFGFGGKLEDGSFRRISFGLRDFGVTNLAEMTKLNGQKITLDGIRNVASLEAIPDNNCQIQALGQLYLRSVKYNSDSENLTISGTFGFNYDGPDCDKVAVTYGRFDFSTDSFYPK